MLSLVERVQIIILVMFRLVRELEKKFSGKHVVFIVWYTIALPQTITV